MSSSPTAHLAHITTAVSLASLAALTLTACTTTKDLHSQLLASDAGITHADVERAIDGLATNLSIGLTLDDNELTSGELRDILTLACQSNVDTTYTEVLAQNPSGAWVNLEPAYVELGFPSPDTDTAPTGGFRYGSAATCTTIGASA